MRAAVAMISSVVIAAAFALPADAAPAWSVRVDVSAPPSTELTAAACNTSTHCFAVGYRQTDASYTPTIEQGKGSSWSLMKSPVPAGARPNDFPPLADVACAAPKSCFAVGTYRNARSRPTGLIEHWNGSVWQLMKPATPLTTPQGALSQQTSFKSVSCPGAKSCYAVGYYQGLNGAIATLVEHWNGTLWAVQTAPTSAAPATVLNGVSCAADTSCFAVGTSYWPRYTKPFVARWSGTTWSTVASPYLASAALSTISCASATSCFAVGSVATPTSIALLEHWNGAKWSRVLLNMPAANHFSGVSCPTTTFCLAVGQRAWTGVSSRTFAEQWDGKTWSAVTTPNHAGATSNWLDSVACSSASVCLSVGSYVSNDKLHALIENYG